MVGEQHEAMYREFHAHFVLNIAERLYFKTFVHLSNFPSAMTEKND